MTLDRDGKIRMDCSSPYAMAKLIGLKDRFDIAFGNDTDSDRHGIVTPQRGPDESQPLPRGRRSHYLFSHRPELAPATPRSAKTAREQQRDRPRGRQARARAGRGAGRLQVVRRRACSTARSASAARRAPGASFLRRDGTVWTTDKDGIILDLLAVEIMARTGRDPFELYSELTREPGLPSSREDRRSGQSGAKAILTEALAGGHPRVPELAGRPDPGPAHDGAGERRGHRRPEGRHRPRLVRGASDPAPKRSTALRGESAERSPAPHQDEAQALINSALAGATGAKG